MGTCPNCLVDNEEGTATCYSCGHSLQHLPQKEGSWEEAVASYDEAIRLDPEDAEAYFNRGVAYDNPGEYTAAIRDYSKVISLDGTDVEAYLHRADAYVDLEQFEAALQDYEECIRLNPEDSDAYFSRGLTYFRLGQYRAALDDYHQSLSIDSEDAEICAHGALAATLLGLDEEAEEFKDDAVELGFASEFLQIVIDELKKRRQLEL